MHHNASGDLLLTHTHTHTHTETHTSLDGGAHKRPLTAGEVVWWSAV